MDIIAEIKEVIEAITSGWWQKPREYQQVKSKHNVLSKDIFIKHTHTPQKFLLKISEAIYKYNWVWGAF